MASTGEFPVLTDELFRWLNQRVSIIDDPRGNPGDVLTVEMIEQAVQAMAPYAIAPIQGYYPFVFPTLNTAPDPDPTAAVEPPKIENVTDLRKMHEGIVEKIVDSMPEVQKYMVYKYLYVGNNIRIGDCTPKTDALLSKELRELKSKA